jgi:ATP-dependent RNA helicase RhlB
MKRTAEMLGWKLEANGFPAKVLTGDLSQDRRQKVIEGMKAGKLKMLVATDVAARGLHIEGITHVINYDLPDDAANYVHRIGRTARAGKSGKAYSLACEDHVLNLPEIEKYIERKLEAEWIEDSELVKDTAPRYSERARGPKPFERKDKKPDSRRTGAGAGGRFSSKDRKVNPAPVKKEEPAAASSPAPEKPAPRQFARPGRPEGLSGPGGPRPRNRRRPQGPKKEAGAEAKKEAGPEARPEKRSFERPANDRRPRHRGSAPSAAAVKTEQKKTETPAPHKTETASKESKEKGGLLKRFFKFLKKT